MLSENKAEIVAKWLEETLRIFHESSVNYLLHSQDQFQNPVGYRLREGLGILFDDLVLSENKAAAHNALEDIIRIRAVQGVSASQAVAFVHRLKYIVRAEIPDAAAHFPDEYAALELHIDELGLTALDLFMKCRKQINEARINENRRLNFVRNLGASASRRQK